MAAAYTGEARLGRYRWSGRGAGLAPHSSPCLPDDAAVARSLQAEMEEEDDEGNGGLLGTSGGLDGVSATRAGVARLHHERGGSGRRWPSQACSVFCCLLAVCLLAFLLAIACLVLKGERWREGPCWMCLKGVFTPSQ